MTITPQQPPMKDNMIVTLNKMGYMGAQPESYNQAFIDFAATQSDHCLEIGAAYGGSTIPALEKGARIIANDLSADHLELLKNNTPIKLRDQLTLMPGRFPEDLSIKKNSLGAVLASRVFHFLEPSKLLPAFQQVFDILKEGGKLFLLVSSPHVGNVDGFQCRYREARQNKEPWPGLITDMQTFLPARAHELPDFINLLDIQDVAALLCDAGFHIQKIGYSSVTSGHPKDIKNDGREQVGAIAVKPILKKAGLD